MGSLRHGLTSLVLLALAVSPATAQNPAAAKTPAAAQKTASAQKPASAQKSAEPRITKEGAEFFEKKIRPIFIRHCYECHSGDPKKAKAGFVLDTRDGLRKGGESGAVIVPGHAEDSRLIEAIRYEGLEMPPKEQLPDELIEELVRWVEMGAPDPRTGKAANAKGKIDLVEARKFWAFQRPKATPVPRVVDTAWPATDIDHYVRARQEQEHLQPVADADRVTLIRRVTFDLTGLPPTPQEIDAFVGDKSESAFATVVDRLLASPRFGERWGRHWLDVVRYGESTGKERNIPYRYAWRYRNYVIDAFNADKPYDRFVVEQLAGDLVPVRSAAEKSSLLVATGFLAIGTKGVNTRDLEQYRYDVIDDQIDVTSRAFLGMTVACARCHDHKYDPIPTTDYYALAGIFRSTETLAGVEPRRRSGSDSNLLPLVEPARQKKETATGKQSPELSPQQREQKARQEEIAKLESQLDGLQAMQAQSRGRMQQRMGMGGRGKQGQKAARPQLTPMQVREQIRNLEDRLDELERRPTPLAEVAMGVREATPVNSPVLNRGEVKEKGAEVPRGVMTVIKTPQGNVNLRQSGRLELANWIASRENPLTARVMVNRVWQHLFGQGLVDSVDNFGALGEEPTHPELLDALSLQFVNDKWSVKKLIRSIVLSRTYRLGSEHHAENFAADPSNKYLWHMERRRLDAEEIRDAILAVSGELDLKRPENSPMLELGNSQIRGGKALQEIRKPTDVRSVYLPVVRSFVPEVLQVFDAADPSLIIGKRDVTTVPTQALFLMNSPFVMRQATQMGRRVLQSEGLTPPARVDLAYRLALGRLPTDSERTTITRYLADYRGAFAAEERNGNPRLAAWTSVCQTLFASGEFRYLY